MKNVTLAESFTKKELKNKEQLAQLNTMDVVVGEWDVTYVPPRLGHQSEEELEKNFITQLLSLGYERFSQIEYSVSRFKEKQSELLLKNLKNQLENLNKIKFTEDEWEYVKKELRRSDSKTKLAYIQKGEKLVLQTKNPDGTTRFVSFFDKTHLSRNHIQVMNQYQTVGNATNRYDVTILVNGLPLVHCELKRRGVLLREAFNQIERYQRDSFWADEKLFEFVQIFVISNGTETKYYSNTTRGGKASSYQFTYHWTDANNQKIKDLHHFTNAFLNKNVLLNMLNNYCVYQEKSQKLLVMRPYQIMAVQKIIEKVNIAIQNDRFNNGNEKETLNGGYIWHTTGSGKTLTSFKTATLIANNFSSSIYKTIFIVDRQDLDYQTVSEYEKFQPGCVASTAKTKQLFKILKNDDQKIVVTTIQKLNTLLTNKEMMAELKKRNVLKKPVVLIFDECHRSQFGEQQTNIKRAFEKFLMFGFTGTPILAENAISRQGKQLTTENVFGPPLHKYTITNGIDDNNVLKFKIDYCETFDKNKADDKLIQAIDREKAYVNVERMSKISQFIIDHYDLYTLREGSFNQKQKFNAMFCVSSIEAAKFYYEKLQELNRSENKNLNIGIIYSASKDEMVDGCFVGRELEEDNESADNLNKSDKEFLEKVIKDYNEKFKTSFSLSSFSDYYKNVSKRVKNDNLEQGEQIDLLIVVNMFLTGFDAPKLNTLFIDKFLQHQGLVQAFSRTNRILDDTKTHGNIVCFRNLIENVEEALKLFGNGDSQSVVFLKDFKHYFDKYKDDVEVLAKTYPLKGTDLVLKTKSEKKNFISHVNMILRQIQILKSFTEFKEAQFSNVAITQAQWEDYLSHYNGIYDEYKRKLLNKKETDISEDISFEINLISTEEVDSEYIIKLILKFAKDEDPRTINDAFRRLLDSNYDLRTKKELIEEFFQKVKLLKEDGAHKDENDLLQEFEDFKNEKLDEFVKTHFIDSGLKENVDVRTLLKKCYNNTLTYQELVNEMKPKKFGAAIETEQNLEKTYNLLKETVEKFFP